MRTIATILIIMSVALLAAWLPGCAANAGGDARGMIGAMRADGMSIVDDTTALDAHTDAAGKPLVKAVKTKGQRIVANSYKADKAVDKQVHQTVVVQKKLDKLSGSWGVTLMRIVDWGLPALLIGWIGLEIGAKWFESSPLGAIFGFALGLLGKIPLIGRFFGGGSPPPNPFSSL